MLLSIAFAFGLGCAKPAIDVVTYGVVVDPAVSVSESTVAAGWSGACSFAYWPEPPIEGVDSQPGLLDGADAMLQLDYGRTLYGVNYGNGTVLTARFDGERRVVSALYDPNLVLYDIDVAGERRLPDGTSVEDSFEVDYVVHDVYLDSDVTVHEIHRAPIRFEDVPVHEREFSCE